MRRSIAVGVGVLILGVSLLALAQKVKIAPDQRYILLATTKTSTMQEELDEAAAQGFRIVVGSPTSGNEMVLLLERVATPPEVYRYMLLATDKTSTMQKELDQATAEGFRLLSRTMVAKKSLLKFPFRRMKK